MAINMGLLSSGIRSKKRRKGTRLGWWRRWRWWTFCLLSETKSTWLQCGGAEEQRDVRDEVCRMRESEREKERQVSCGCWWRRETVLRFLVAMCCWFWWRRTTIEREVLDLLLLLVFVKTKGFCGCSIVFWRERLTQSQREREELMVVDVLLLLWGVREIMDTNSSIEGYLFCIAPVRQGGGGSQFIQTFCVLSGRQFSQWRHKGDLVRKSSSSSSIFSCFPLPPSPWSSLGGFAQCMKFFAFVQGEWPLSIITIP